MQAKRQPFDDVEAFLAQKAPDHPVLFFRPDVLEATARGFQKGFSGEVSYAVKANDLPDVISTLAHSGIRAFDVASPAEMQLVRDLVPDAVLHYNNPVRSPAEIAHAVEMGVESYSVDGLSELAKLSAHVPEGVEVSVRLALDVAGAAYEFGFKFGETPDGCVDLLRAVSAAGYRPSMTFHPGTQCTEPEAWAVYVARCAEIAARAEVQIERLNVGGGFPADRGAPIALEPIFDEITKATKSAFGGRCPKLVCEPGRGLVAEAFAAAFRVKALRERGEVFLNDGIYGLLSEALVMGPFQRHRVVAPDGTPRAGTPVERIVFGPTCDSVDRMPETSAFPEDMVEGDYVIFDGLGAYSTATNTRFNGYGVHEIVTLRASGQ